jgi:hypothetical protein
MYASAWIITKSAEIESKTPKVGAQAAGAKIDRSNSVDVEELAI